MMKRALTLIATAVLAGTACADVWELQLFWSTTGINDPNYVYFAGEMDFLPYFVPPTPVEMLAPGAYDLFLWGKVTDPNNLFYAHPEGAQIYGLDLTFEGDAAHGVNVAYRHGRPYPGRWDGNHPILLNGVMAAVTSNGILLVPYWIPDLYRYEYVDFLIGAARITGTDGQVKIMALDLADGLGIAMRDWATGEDIPDPPVLPAVVTFVPEPASLVLALVALVGRARKRPLTLAADVR